jgi:hypothetical protein
VNPPPTYAQRAQRLRTPTDVLRTKSGTCIDLALLFAACLEYVDIYPVIFLLPGHALPGYWVGDARHADFLQVGEGGMDPAGGGDEAAAASASQGVVTTMTCEQDAPWMLSTVDRRGPIASEIRARLKRPDLIALETVGLTDGTSFCDAQDLATEHLAQGMESMVDIRIARNRKITPLPRWAD